MKKIILLSAALAVAAIFSTTVKSAPNSAEQLLAAFQAAATAKDTNAALALANWQGVSVDMKEMETEMILDAVKQFKTAKLAPLPADAQLDIDSEGVHYSPNVAVVGVIDVQFAEAGNSVQIPYGKKDDSFYFAGTVEKKISYTATKEKQINVMVFGTITPEPVVFTGSCSYVKSGKELKQDISGKGNFSVAVWGDYIKSVTVQKTSDDSGWIQLRVAQDGTNILFKSEKVDTKTPVTYEGKQP